VRVLRDAPTTAASSGFLELDERRAAYAFRVCLGRSPTSAELHRLTRFVRDQSTAYGRDEGAAAGAVSSSFVIDRLPSETRPTTVDLAVWTAVGRVLLNLDEFITRE
jgi:hypothetical protein